MLIKKIKSSKRGLTFSLNENQSEIGSKYRYIVNKDKNEILIIPDKSGQHTVSRKKCGLKFKPLYDLRSTEVREVVSQSDYMEIMLLDSKIVVKTYQKIKSTFIAKKSRIISIDEILGKQTGEIILKKVAGQEFVQTDADTFNLDTSVLPEYFQSHDRRKELERVYQVASLFSGAGLLDYPFSKSPAFDIRFACDFNENACMTYRENIGDHIICKDIMEVDGSELPKNLDVILSGVCCQAFSNANRHNIDSDEGEKKTHSCR